MLVGGRFRSLWLTLLTPDAALLERIYALLHPSPALQRLRLVYGLLSLRVPDDVQKPFRFCGAKFLRNHSRSGHNHVLGRLYYCIRAFV
jgi:hypothetical protein